MTEHSKSGRARSLDDVDLIVDTDAHVTESVDDLVAYMEGKDKGLKQIIKNAAFPEHDIYSVAHPLPPFIHTDAFGDVYGDQPTGTVEAKRQEMKEFDLDYSVLNPTINLSLATVNNDHMAVALAKAYNSWILDKFVDADDNIVTPITAAPQAPDKAAEEIDDRADMDGVVGVSIPATGLVPPPGHRWYDPIYQAAQDNDLPVMFHSGSGATADAFPVVRKWAETYAEDHAVVHPFTHMWNLTSILFQGVPEKFPDLDFIFQEAGIAWIPYMTWRLDDHYLELSDEVPGLQKLPSKYIEERFYFSTQPLGYTQRNPRHLALAIEIAGPDNIMYSSDLPHPDFDPPEELFDRIQGHFDRETVNNIMGGTAVEVFGLEN
ncbi:amidohydrolase family protein [Haladaptatus halobius]|uniref:amidohydrolase family protein n=1 Tax=Haladaptatus halobius TaxID=2884875 RepID=UPI001D0B6A73|nr:amidohydrolase family protein [Haladaptatus halobius]